MRDGWFAAGGLELPSPTGTASAHIQDRILLGVVVTALAAYLSVRFLLRSFQTRALTPLAIYCLALGPTSGRHWRTAGGGPRPRRRDRTQKPASAAAPSAAMISVVASPLRGSCSS